MSDTAFTPVIMAAGEHRELWPLSRVNVPIQFLRDGSGTSPFGRWLAFFAGMPEAGRPVVVVTASAVERARRQVAEAGGGADLVVLPSARGLRAALCIAALVRDPSELLVFADAPTAPGTDTAYAQALASLLMAHQQAGGPILSALPVSANADLRRGARCDHGLVRPGPPPDTPDAGGYRLGPIWTATAGEIVGAVEAAEPDTARVCRRLAAEAERVATETWIDAARWSHLDAASRSLVSLAGLPGTRLRPVALQTDAGGRPVLRANVTEGDVATLDARNCDVRSRDHLTVVAGCENLRIYATGDATLVAAPGHEAAIERYVRDLWLAERPEAFAHRRERHGWGHENELFRAHDYAVRMLEVEPGGTLETRGGDACERWTLARGRAVVTIEGEAVPLATGDTATAPPHARITCRNTSDERLVAIAVATSARSRGESHQPPAGQNDQQAQAKALVERLQHRREEAPADQHARGREHHEHARA